jgi:1,4-dihydroxy-2-naphthoate octaprenyltransferase
MQLDPWIQAARPQTLPAALGPVIIGLALAHGHSGLNVLTALLTIICALLLQISSNLINDYYDGIRGTDTKERLGPIRVTAAGLLPPSSVKKAFLITLALSFFCGLYLMSIAGLPIIIIGLSSLFCAWAYTGGPFPLSHFALGELFALLFFGPVAVWGTYYIQVLKFDHHDHLSVILWGISVGLIASALMGINNLRDIVQDKQAGKITIATLLGAKKMRLCILLMVTTGLGFAYQLLTHYALLTFSQTLAGDTNCAG